LKDTLILKITTSNGWLHKKHIAKYQVCRYRFKQGKGCLLSRSFQ